jgi:hypothetical protein
MLEYEKYQDLQAKTKKKTQKYDFECRFYQPYYFDKFIIISTTVEITLNSY